MPPTKRDVKRQATTPRLVSLNGATESLRQQLCAQAYSQHGLSEVDGFANDLDYPDQVGVGLDLVAIHWCPEDN